MSSELSPENVFPLAFGNEVESGLQIGNAKKMDEPYDLASNLHLFVPKELVVHDSQGRLFLSNGGLMYPDSHDLSSYSSLRTNIELATAECSTPSELTAHISGMQRVLERTVQNYLADFSESLTSELFARIQRRVVDSRGSRKGCHDNFGIAADNSLFTDDKLGRDRISNGFLSHLATRSLITGAGYMRSSGYDYAQKVNGLSGINHYGYSGSMYRVVGSETDDGRLEVRCNDVNISDWATWMRIGSTALVIALEQTPISADLAKNQLVPHGIKAIDFAKSINRSRVNKQGQLTASPDQLRAINFQQLIAELAMDKLPDYTGELPTEYWQLASELYKFCEDYKRVINKEATFEVLADRADWATKLSVIRSRIEKDKAFGIERQFGDKKSMFHDLRYDYIGYSALDGVVSSPTVGYGHRWRANGRSLRTISNEKINGASKVAPTDTRAHIRTKLMRELPVESCDWDRVSFEPIQDDTRTITLRLPNVKDPNLPMREQTVLNAYDLLFNDTELKP